MFAGDTDHTVPGIFVDPAFQCNSLKASSCFASKVAHAWRIYKQICFSLSERRENTKGVREGWPVFSGWLSFMWAPPVGLRAVFGQHPRVKPPL